MSLSLFCCTLILFALLFMSAVAFMPVWLIVLTRVLGFPLVLLFVRLFVLALLPLILSN